MLLPINGAWITKMEMDKVLHGLKHTRDSIATLSLWAIVKLSTSEWMANRVTNNAVEIMKDSAGWSKQF